MPTQQFTDLQYRLFVVGERPFCLWDVDIQKRTLDYLARLDAGYFEYMATTHVQNVRDQEEARNQHSQHAALALRSVYSQALETLFALVGAAVQAPRCVPAWIVAYRNHELRSIVDCIHNRKPLLSQLDAKVLSWSVISEVLLESLVLEDKGKQTAIKAGFAQLWSKFATEFLDEEFAEEYNSIKHGLRVKPGGFHLAFGVEDKPGVRAPAERMRLLGKSEFGSSYLVSKGIGDQIHHRQLKRHHRNWDPEDITWGLLMAAMSITNIRSGLMIVNGQAADQVQFSWPSDLGVFTEPWKRSIQMGVTSMQGFDIHFESEFIRPFSRDEILRSYLAGQDAGMRRLYFDQETTINETADYNPGEAGIIEPNVSKANDTGDVPE